MKTLLDRLSEIPGISEFSSKDEQDFYKFLNNSKDITTYAFENNWPYILQATRNGHYKYNFSNSIVYFTLRFKPQSKSNFVVIVNFLGLYRKEAVLELCKYLKQRKINVMLKNIDQKKLSFWKKHGFTESIKPWSKYSFRDDNSFPLHIISSETIRTRRFNKDYKRLFRKFDDVDIKTEPYNSSNDSLVKTLLSKNATFLFNKGVDQKEEIIGAHLFFFDDFIIEKIRLQHLKNGKLIGVSYLTVVNKVIFYNALFCSKEKDLMKYLLYCGMRYATTTFSKVKFFSLQGSENKGQDFFKKRYNPSLSIEKTHVILK